MRDNKRAGCTNRSWYPDNSVKRAGRITRFETAVGRKERERLEGKARAREDERAADERASRAGWRPAFPRENQRRWGIATGMQLNSGLGRTRGKAGN
jgi:hypothetical protein